MRPAKIRPVWSESSLSAWSKLGSLATHWAHSEDSYQTGRMPRLISVFAGRTLNRKHISTKLFMSQSQKNNRTLVFFCLFGFNISFNNFSVISRRCLVVTGSSLLTFIVLPHWSIMPQTLDMKPHPVTLSWHRVDQSLLYPIRLSAKSGAASTSFNDFGMSCPGIQPVTSRFP